MKGPNSSGKTFRVIWLKFCLKLLFTGKKAIDASILENFQFYTGNGKPETVIFRYGPLRVFFTGGIAKLLEKMGKFDISVEV